MLKIKTIHNNLVKQVRLLIGDQLADMQDASGNTWKAVIKDTTVTFQDDTSTLPEYPFIVVDLLQSGKRYLTAKNLSTNDTVYITTMRMPLFQITCYGGDCTDILDKLQLLMEWDNTRIAFDDALNVSTTANVKENSSVKVQYFDEIREVPAFIETSFINTAETTLKLCVESHFEIPDSSIIEEIQGSFFVYDYEGDPDPIEVAVVAP